MSEELKAYAAIMPAWAQSMECAVTVCDAACVILAQNRQARELYRAHGDLAGYNLRQCHSPRSVEIIDRLLSQGGTNIYTIEKGPVHKLIFQSAWRDEATGAIAGLVEISIVTPADMPHYVRPAK